MYRRIYALLLLSILVQIAMSQSRRQEIPEHYRNPIIQTCFTTDPAPMVDGDRLYVFTGHDEEKADFFWMNDWRLFSTTDMVNWTDHGCPLAQCDFAWADDRAWAAQCIKRGKKYYLYVPIHSRLSGGMAIGVGVADKVTGPYHDALGKPLYEDGRWDHIDPTVFIDEDDQAYLYWGNPRLYSVKLGKDMISLDGPVKCDTTLTRYTEGPWILKRPQGKYFMVYAAGGIPESIAYCESTSPLGPWTYVGDIMPQDNATASFTNHSGTVTFRGHNYFFYHTGWLPGGGGFGRSVCVEEFCWTPDGHFPIIRPSREGVKPIGSLNPYERVQGETIAYSYGVKTEWNRRDGVYVSDIHNNDWIRVSEVDFDAKGRPKKNAAIRLRAASSLQGGSIEYHLDSIRGKMLARVEVRRTGGGEQFRMFEAPIEELPTGRHEVFIVFRGVKGAKLLNLDWWVIS